SFNSGFPQLPSPTEGIKAATGARSPARFSFERFVGRDEEIKRLEERFDEVRAGPGPVVFIIGDPGGGKTELVNRFQSQLGPNAALFVTGQFYEYGGDNPYRPYLDGIYSVMQSASGAQSPLWPLPPIEGLIDKIRSNLDEIDRLINGNFRENASSGEEQKKYRTFELFVEIFMTISESMPIVLFLDDVQWADPLSLEFLAYLIRNTEAGRMLFLCTARPQEL